jgi:hypothetical protein
MQRQTPPANMQIRIIQLCGVVSVDRPAPTTVQIGSASVLPGPPASLSVTLKIEAARVHLRAEASAVSPPDATGQTPGEVMHGATPGHGPLRRERADALYAAE